MGLDNDLTLWSTLVGMALPWLVGLFQFEHWGSKINALIFAAACFVAALITEFIRNGSDFSVQGYFHTFIVVTIAAIALYKLYWKPSGHIDEARAVGAGSIGAPDKPPENTSGGK